jgi:hypothetical protein
MEDGPNALLELSRTCSLGTSSVFSSPSIVSRFRCSRVAASSNYREPHHLCSGRHPARVLPSHNSLSLSPSLSLSLSVSHASLSSSVPLLSLSLSLSLSLPNSPFLPLSFFVFPGEYVRPLLLAGRLCCRASSLLCNVASLSDMQIRLNMATVI